ncbi:DUF4221 family protein [Belliella aquatica]|nr:DUF4221 family protein [Belliella aquatica]
MYFYSYSKNSIAAFEKETTELLFETNFEKEGPNGMGGSISDLKIDKDGNIWIYTPGDKLYQMSSTGEVIKKYELKTEEIFEKNISLFGYFEIKDDILFAPTIPMTFQWTSLTIDEMASLSNLITYDLKEDTYEVISTFDKGYLGTNLNKMIMPSMILGKNGEVIINHNYKDIFVIQDGKQNSFEASFSGFSSDPPVSSMPDMFDDMNEIMRIMNYSDAYERIAYLPIHDKYMRLAKFEESPADGMDFDRTFLHSKWALIFLNDQFEKEGEIILPESETNGNYIFETKEGVWFSTDHPDNPNLDEEKFQFRLLKVK